MNLHDLIAHLGRDFDTVANMTLATSADRLGDQVRAALSTPPGGPHDHPWLQSGHLRDSVEVKSKDYEAVVASTSDIALYQEHGTASIPPRPTFATLAITEGEAIAHAIALAVTAALKGP